MRVKLYCVVLAYKMADQLMEVIADVIKMNVPEEVQLKIRGWNRIFYYVLCIFLFDDT